MGTNSRSCKSFGSHSWFDGKHLSSPTLSSFSFLPLAMSTKQLMFSLEFFFGWQRKWFFIYNYGSQERIKWNYARWWNCLAYFIVIKDINKGFHFSFSKLMHNSLLTLIKIRLYETCILLRSIIVVNNSWSLQSFSLLMYQTLVSILFLAGLNWSSLKRLDGIISERANNYNMNINKKI